MVLCFCDRREVRKVKQKVFFQLLGVLFAAKVVFGVVYILFGWEATIAGWIMPFWLMAAAVVADGYLAYQSCKFSKAKR